MKTKVEFYSHFVKLTNILPKHQFPIRDFSLKHLVEKNVEKDPQSGRLITRFGKVYVARTEDKQEIRIHRNYWDVFERELIQHGIVHRDDLEYIEHVPSEGVSVEFIRPSDGKTLRDYQVDIVSFLKEEGYSKVIELAMGLGKGLTLDTEIKTKKGSILLRDLKIDDVVTTPSGELSHVVQITDNEDRPCYLLTTEDDATVTCDDVHLWTVRSSHLDYWETINTLEMLSRMLKGESFYLPTRKRPDIMKSFLKKVKVIHEGKYKPIKPATCEDLLELLKENPSVKAKSDGKYIYLKQKSLRRIKSLKYIGHRDTRCIQIDHPEKLFVVNKDIVTHNTFTSMSFALDYGKRLAIMVLGRYIERWWDEIENYAMQDEIIEIRGMRDLIATLEYQMENPNYLKNIKIILITTTTMSDYIKHYESLKKSEREQCVPPEMVWEILGVGLRINDESHQHFHANFMIDLYTHLPKTIALSATLKVADSFLSRMYNIVYPQSQRIGGGLQNRYTDCTAVIYRFNDPGKIRCRNRKKMYNHTEFEKWLMKNPKLQERYFKMIDTLVDSDYRKVRKEGEKCLVFFSTKKMCGRYVDYLRKRKLGLVVNRYISEDKYENLLKSDIAVSTLGSAGTAVDVPDLLTCIMTTALKSEQANLQALGRLRMLKDSQTRFFYLVCADISKHMSYHYAKRHLFREWVKTHHEYYVGERI